jgi:phosphatidate phosphatase PAH1
MLVDCNAYDLILVRNHDQSRIACSECLLKFGGVSMESNLYSADYRVELVLVDYDNGSDHRFLVWNNTFQEASNFHYTPHEKGEEYASSLVNPFNSTTVAADHDRQILADISKLLKPGANAARYLITNTETRHLLGICELDFFVYELGSPDQQKQQQQQQKIIVVDVDGTITKSTMKGFLYTAIYEDFAENHCHDGICYFLSSLMDEQNNDDKSAVKFVYLTNRPISYAKSTRKFLKEFRQDSYRLPRAPLIGFMGNLAGVFKMDLYSKNAHEFKFDTLERYITRPFRDLDAIPDNFVLNAGIGNTFYDMHAYHRAGIPLERLFLIDKDSRIYCLDKKMHDNHMDKNPDQSLPGLLVQHPQDFGSTRGTVFNGYRDEELRARLMIIDSGKRND